MKTPANNERPEIEWDRGELYETHDHEKVYNCTGESKDGRKWEGSWSECNGEFMDIVDIEEV